MYWAEGQAASPAEGDPNAGCGDAADETSTRDAKYWPSADGLNEMRSVDDVRGCMVYCSGNTCTLALRGPHCHLFHLSAGIFAHSTHSISQSGRYIRRLHWCSQAKARHAR
ncbi:hypothetical protein WJX84_009193 [Apatococcus fuscideae]|uniref:Apple domain-containing protein n=1 Tax=Apatococcus fuscideae TaxID=2026836 RepID=A0AAW1SQC2_9CHLO